MIRLKIKLTQKGNVFAQKHQNDIYVHITI